MTTAALPATELGDPAGFPIIALHGGGCATRSQWFRLATEGLPARRWICPDLRGHGEGPRQAPWTLSQFVDDVIATLDAHEVERADVIGSSLGARLTIEVARHHPSRVRSAVLLDPPLLTQTEWTDLWGKELAAFMEDLVAREFDSVEELIALAQPTPLPPDVKGHAEREVLTSLRRTNTGRFKVAWDAAFIQPLADEVGKSSPATFGAFAGDVLLLVAGRYQAVSPAGRNFLQAELDDRLTARTLDAGHALMWDDFAGVVAATTEFLAAQDATEPRPVLGKAVAQPN